MLLLGLTGNIACGKSTVARRLAEHGAVVIDADRLVRDLYADPTFARRVAALFDAPVLAADGSVDRAALGRVVFADEAALRRLEQLVHPAVAELRDRRLRELRARPDPPPAAVLEAVKLIESGQADACDAVWCVACDPATQLRRMLEHRGLTEEAARRRLEAQPDLAGKHRHIAALPRRVPLVLIPNDGPPAALMETVDREWARWRDEAGAAAD